MYFEIIFFFKMDMYFETDGVFEKGENRKK